MMKSLRAVARSASQKAYSPSPVQDHKDEGFGAGARGGVDYGGGARHEVAKTRLVRGCLQRTLCPTLYNAGREKP